MSEQVDVLLATFQGANYLEEQLESILTQSHPQLHLWVRDDGSTDQTLSILQKWAQTYPQKITLLSSDGHLGIKGNFSELMKQSQAPYVMFADQDDRWLPNKVEISLDHLKAMERQYGSHLPLLVHTDLKVVDQNLEEIAPSFWHYAGLHPDQTSLNRLLSQNVLTGCTMLMNRALVELAYPIPSIAVMHDWWIALISSCFGHIHFVNQPTILYRQHESNDVGAKRYSLRSFLYQSSKEACKKSNTLKQTYHQANYLLERFEHLLPFEKQDLLRAYGELEKLSYFKKKYQMIKYQFFKQGFLRNAKMLLSK
jgi:glycosyltransferase involved in cell wall biosynthesis